MRNIRTFRIIFIGNLMRKEPVTRMPRYIVERTLSEDVNLPFSGVPEQERQLFIENNTLLGAVWIHSYVSTDRKKCFCLYEAPSPETVRKAAARNRLPVDRIVEVRLLDPTS